MLVYALIGIGVVSVINYVLFWMYQTDKFDNDVLAIFMGGVLSLLTYGFCQGVNGILKVITRTKYKGVVLCPDGTYRYCESKKLDYWLEKDGYDYIPFDVSKSWYWLCKDDKKVQQQSVVGAINSRYIPRKIWKDFEKLK